MEKEKVLQYFTEFFREEKGYDSWSNEEIDGSVNIDDIIECLEFTKESLINYYDIKNYNVNISATKKQQRKSKSEKFLELMQKLAETK